MPLTPTVAIVGRPNVGKSTLFNRLLGRRHAIVHDLPGITRDRITGTVELAEDRPIQIVDTGGLVPGDDPLGLNQQVFLAVEESDLLLFVVDGKQGLVSADEEVWSHFRRFNKPTVLVVNKADTNEAKNRFSEFYSLGIDRQLLISAEHGAGIGDLREALALALPEIPDIPVPPDAPAIAIVGRPNVGKSSLLNKISGLNRALVSPVAGTTRDPVDTLITRGDKSYLLIDTAGIRRRSQVSGAPEELAVMMARRQIERSQVAVLVIDAAAGVTSSDLAIAGSIWELGRAAVVAINKWDLLDEEAAGEAGALLRAARRAARLAGAGQRLGPQRPGDRQALGSDRQGAGRLPPQARHRPAQPAVRGLHPQGGPPPRSAAPPGGSTTPPRSRRRRRPSCFSPTARCPGTTTTGATWRTACARRSTSPACRCGWWSGGGPSERLVRSGRMADDTTTAGPAAWSARRRA